METYLEHYGVLGMKWGVRKDPQKAYNKSIKKLKKLDTKVAKQQSKAAKLTLKSAKKEEKAYRTSSTRKYKKLTGKSLKAKRKAANQTYKSTKTTKKAVQWVNSMNEYFSGVKVSSISTDDIAIGQKYAVQVIDDYMREHQS